jgi:hypothetical protein
MKYVAIPHKIKGESKIKMIDTTLTLILSRRGRGNLKLLLSPLEGESQSEGEYS